MTEGFHRELRATGRAITLGIEPAHRAENCGSEQQGYNDDLCSVDEHHDIWGRLLGGLPPAVAEVSLERSLAEVIDEVLERKHPDCDELSEVEEVPIVHAILFCPRRG